jgi:hypothetical protein
MLGLSAPSDIGQATALLGEILKVLGTAFFTVLTFVAGIRVGMSSLRLRQTRNDANRLLPILLRMH